MAFNEVRLPEYIDFGVVGGPTWNTDIVELFSGYEQRNQNWLATRYQYTLSYSVRTASQISTILSFFNSQQGRAIGFRFRDWSDFFVYNQQLGIGDGSTKIFQFIKTYTNGSTPYTRQIYKIVASGSQVYTVPRIYLNSVLQSTGYTIDYTLGTLTFASAPSSTVVIAADFEFDVPVRFDVDQLKVRMEYNQEFYIDNIPLIEIRTVVV